jgi:hypothetical protein
LCVLNSINTRTGKRFAAVGGGLAGPLTEMGR